jgi:hypothetical protein
MFTETGAPFVRIDESEYVKPNVLVIGGLLSITSAGIALTLYILRKRT